MDTFRMILVGPFRIFSIVEIPGIIRTGDHTVSAANTSVMIDDNDTILPFIGSLDRAGLDTGRVVTVIA